jgi:hypothetical protein
MTGGGGNDDLDMNVNKVVYFAVSWAWVRLSSAPASCPRRHFKSGFVWIRHPGLPGSLDRNTGVTRKFNGCSVLEMMEIS